MTSFATGITSDLSQNPVLLYKLTGQENKTTQFSSVDEYLDTVWPTDLFPKAKTDKSSYGLAPYIDKLPFSDHQQKENEWIELVGMDFYSLSEEKSNFLLRTAGIFNFEEDINIKRVYETSIY